MRHKIISVSAAKAKLLGLIRMLHDEGQAFALTKDGHPVLALVPMEDYEALVETFDITSNPRTVENLKQALEDEKKKRLWKKDASGKWSAIKSKENKTAA